MTKTQTAAKAPAVVTPEVTEAPAVVTPEVTEAPAVVTPEVTEEAVHMSASTLAEIEMGKATLAKAAASAAAE